MFLQILTHFFLPKHFQYLDLIGTGYQDKKRPATFHTKFLDAYKARVRNGLWQFSPEQLEEVFALFLILGNIFFF